MYLKHLHPKSYNPIFFPDINEVLSSYRSSVDMVRRQADIGKLVPDRAWNGYQILT